MFFSLCFHYWGTIWEVQQMNVCCWFNLYMIWFCLHWDVECLIEQERGEDCWSVWLVIWWDEREPHRRPRSYSDSHSEAILVFPKDLLWLQFYNFFHRFRYLFTVRVRQNTRINYYLIDLIDITINKDGICLINVINKDKIHTNDPTWLKVVSL